MISRRRFLLAGSSTLAWAASSSGTFSAASPNDSAYFAYVGCYTSAERSGRGTGISVFRVAADGSWTLVQVADSAPNPSWLVVDRAGRTLYAAHGDGAVVSSYRIDPATGRLTPLGEQPTGGRNGVHLALSPDERFALLANYATGSVAVFPRAASGELGARTQLIHLDGTPGPIASDQKGPQPHEVCFDATGRHVLVPDKGTDRVHRLSYDPQTGAVAPLGPAQSTPAGSGPRHLVFHPGLPLLYLVDELSSRLTAYDYTASTGELAARQSLSTVPSGFSGATTAAEIAITPDGRFVYVSNRGAESIAAFGIAPDGTLIPPAFTDSGGEQPRFMTFSPPGDTLLVANQKTDNIVPFRLDTATGRLTACPPVVTGSPVCITFALRV